MALIAALACRSSAHSWRWRSAWDSGAGGGEPAATAPAAPWPCGVPKPPLLPLPGGPCHCSGAAPWSGGSALAWEGAL